MDAQTIQTMIEKAMPEADVQVLGDDGQHFQAQVISAAFAGKNTIQQHRMVYAALGDAMGGAIHALALKTAAPQAD